MAVLIPADGRCVSWQTADTESVAESCLRRYRGSSRGVRPMCAGQIGVVGGDFGWIAEGAENTLKQVNSLLADINR